MTAKVTNEVLLTTLLSLKSDMGNVMGKIETHQTAFIQHLKDDAKIAEDIRQIQISQAKSKAAARVWGLVGSGVATVAGAAAGFFGSRHG